MAGPSARSIRPLAEGSLSLQGKIQLGLAAAGELGWNLPTALSAVGLGITQATDSAPAGWLSSAVKVSRVVGMVASHFPMVDEAITLRDEWARARRRSRLEQGISTVALKAGMAATLGSLRATQAAIAFGGALDLFQISPLGPATAVLASSIRFVRAANELAKASRLGALVNVVRAKQTRAAFGERLAVVDRLSGAVQATVQKIMKGLQKRIELAASAEKRSQLLADAQLEVQAALADRIGAVAARKLLEVANTWSSLSRGALEELEEPPSVESLQQTFDGLENLRQILASPAEDLKDIRASAAGLADTLVHSLREDARLIKTRAVIRFLLALVAVLMAIAALAALAFPPTAPIILIVGAAVALCSTLTRVGMLGLEAQLLRRADLAPLRERLAELADVNAHVEQVFRIPRRRVRALPNSAVPLPPENPEREVD